MPGGTGGAVYHLSDYAVATLTMNDTILANSTGGHPNGGAINDYQDHNRGEVIGQNGSSNLIESGGNGFPGVVSTADPKFDSKSDNGGPTPTYALQAGSPAINVAGPDCPATDARGVTRPHDGDANGASLCDIGAFEVGPPPNDNFSNARALSGNNVSVRGFNIRATRESGEPLHSSTDGWIGDHSVWYRWTAPSFGRATVDTCEANIDSILAVYTGSAVNTLSRVADNNNHVDCGGSWGSKLAFDTTAGTTYRIAVGDAGGLRESTFKLKLAFAPDTTPPDTTVTSGPSDLVNSRSASFGFESTEANSTFECRLRSLKENAPGVLYSGCVSPRDYPSLEDGPYIFEVRAADRNGNVDPSPASRTFTVDATAPTVVSASPADGATNVPATTNVEATFSEAMDQNTIKEATFALEKLVPNSTGGFDNESVFATVSYDVGTKTATLTPEGGLQPDTLYQVSVGNVFGAGDVKDLAGNKLEFRSWRFTVAENVAPNTNIISGPAGPTKDNTPTFTFGGSDNASVAGNLQFSYKVDGGAWSAYSSATSVTLPALANGPHTFSVKARD